MLKRFGIFAVVLAFLPTASFADVLLVQDSGTWGSTAPTTTWSAASESWSFSFEVNSNPTPAANTPGVGFEISPVSDFTYMLNGSPVATTPTDVLFFNTVGSDGGLMEIDFSGAVFNFFGPQAYSGPESSPTINAGVYLIGAKSDFDSTSPAADLPLSGDVTITDITTTPEPSSLILFGTGLMGALEMLRRKCVRKA